jgi:hypothetical protein
MLICGVYRIVFTLFFGLYRVVIVERCFEILPAGQSCGAGIALDEYVAQLLSMYAQLPCACAPTIV